MPPKVEIVREWLELAANDLKSARVLIESEPPLTETDCFHCQQTAEKALKGFLQWRETPSPKIHDLRRLIDLCTQADPEFDTLRDGVEWLNEFAVDVRYPGAGAAPTEERARRALAEAESAVGFVIDRLPKETHP